MWHNIINKIFYYIGMRGLDTRIIQLIHSRCAPALAVSRSSRIQNQHQHHPPIRQRHVEDHDSESATGSATEWCSVLSH
ncbi:hypothetical protein NC652_027222 [Populus alba x Populus x berolinensis]|nr:hypothetical protein NC652_027222 [Populus alba x Populus x berolinensis]